VEKEWPRLAISLGPEARIFFSAMRSGPRIYRQFQKFWGILTREEASGMVRKSMKKEVWSKKKDEQKS